MTYQTPHLIENLWNHSVIPTLKKYIEIPCKSVAFDPDWEKNGYIDEAMQLLSKWCHAQDIQGMKLKIHKIPGKTPLMLIDIPGQSNQSVLLYGHMDKQPEMTGWKKGLSAWKAVLKEDLLYGRGGADDGYAIFSAITAIKALQTQNLPHPHCTVMIEASEESGSCDLPAYIEKLESQIPRPDLVICLDSGAGNYNQLWATTSLRGLISGVLTVEILKEGVHSGEASGVVPSSFRIMRQLLNRIEDLDTGEMPLEIFKVTIPEARVKEARHVAEVLEDQVWSVYPWVEGARPADLPKYEIVLNRTWRATLSITGVADIPPIKSAGNVLRPKTSLKLSIRIPPTANPEEIVPHLKSILESDPPYGAKINFDVLDQATGWNAPPTAEWLYHAIEQASLKYYGKPALYWGEGGSIPFMHMLGEKFPQAQFLITGVLGPHANAHGPNEFLHIPMAKKLTCCVADVLNSFSDCSLSHL